MTIKRRFKPGEIAVLVVPGLTPRKSDFVQNEIMSQDYYSPLGKSPPEIIPDNALCLLGINPQAEKEHVDKLMRRLAIIDQGSVEKHLDTITRLSQERKSVIVIDSITESET